MLNAYIYAKYICLSFFLFFLSDLNGVLEKSIGEVGDLLLVELHAVLHHAGLHHLTQVTLVYQPVICTGGKDVEKLKNHTDKKEKKIFFIYNEIQMGAIANSYVLNTEGLSNL